MNRSSHQRGFAIALLLWMIAGMSLTVAAVIHFARSDTSMAELRVNEAKARAIGRGAAHLMLRASAMAQGTPDKQEAESESRKLDEEGNAGRAAHFEKTFQIPGGWIVTGKLRPASGLVSLNDSSREELIVVFTGLGKIEEAAAISMADGVLEYRLVPPGFRYTEELLAVSETSRIVYDAVKSFVHPFRSGLLVVSDSPPALRAVAEPLSTENASKAENSRPGKSLSERSSSPLGQVTFEAIAEAMRIRKDGGDERSVSAVDLTLVSPSGEVLDQTIWVGDNDSDPILRGGHIVKKPREKGRD